MAARQVLFHAEARERALRGAAQPAEAIRITLGSKSKPVLKEKVRRLHGKRAAAHRRHHDGVAGDGVVAERGGSQLTLA